VGCPSCLLPQAQRANELAAEQQLADRVSFQVADALQQPFADGEFDLVWSLESGEHMPGKAAFVKELVRVAAPGGRIIVVTWCHRWELGTAATASACTLRHCFAAPLTTGFCPKPLLTPVVLGSFSVGLLVCR
jgi:SAM-dependent methyltransferase